LSEKIQNCSEQDINGVIPSPRENGRQNARSISSKNSPSQHWSGVEVVHTTALDPPCSTTAVYSFCNQYGIKKSKNKKPSQQHHSSIFHYQLFNTNLCINLYSYYYYNKTSLIKTKKKIKISPAALTPYYTPISPRAAL